MKNFVRTGNALERLKKLIPHGVQPKFGSVDEWRAWQAEEGRKRCEELEKQNQRARAKKIFGRAGIQDLHRGCTFANYQIESDGQRRALSMAKSYAQVCELRIQRSARHREKSSGGGNRKSPAGWWPLCAGGNHSGSHAACSGML